MAQGNKMALNIENTENESFLFQKIQETPQRFFGKRGDISLVTLVVGVFAVCTLTLLIFISSSIKASGDFDSVRVIEKLNSKIEAYNFYKNTGMSEEDISRNLKLNRGEGCYYGFQERDKGNLMTVLRPLVDSAKVSVRCLSYVDFAIESANKYNLPDPLVLILLMNQESSCNPSEFSGSSVGLMQINTNDFCKKNYELSSDKKECEKELIEDEEKNIFLGARILREKYNSYAKRSKEDYEKLVNDNCDNENYAKKYSSYAGWERALRGYNGFGCVPPTSQTKESGIWADINFVENVLEDFPGRNCADFFYLEKTKIGFQWSPEFLREGFLKKDNLIYVRYDLE